MSRPYTYFSQHGYLLKRVILQISIFVTVIVDHWTVRQSVPLLMKLEREETGR